MPCCSLELGVYKMFHQNAERIQRRSTLKHLDTQVSKLGNIQVIVIQSPTSANQRLVNRQALTGLTNWKKHLQKKIIHQLPKDLAGFIHQLPQDLAGFIHQLPKDLVAFIHQLPKDLAGFIHQLPKDLAGFYQLLEMYIQIRIPQIKELALVCLTFIL